MGKYLVRRAISSLLIFILFTIIIFLVFNALLPYDYVDTKVLQIPQEAREDLRITLGLDKPLWHQLLDWTGNLLRGDLGAELTLEGFGRPVTEIIFQSLPPTLLVFITGASIAFLLGLWLGKFVGWRARKSLVGSISMMAHIALFQNDSFPLHEQLANPAYFLGID